MRRTPRAFVVAAVLILAACDGKDARQSARDHLSPAESTAVDPTETAGDPGPTSTGVTQGVNGQARCRPSDPERLRAGEPLGDVDGDGEVDQIYLSEGNLGGVTSTGVVSEMPTGRARPSRVLGVADANGDGRGEIFIVGTGVSDSEVVAVATIAVFADCRLTYLKNARDDLAFGQDLKDSEAEGSGLGCVDADGDERRELVRLSYERSGPEVRWRRTVVHIDGGVATNGRTDEGVYMSPQDDDKITLLSDVTCGDNPLDAELGA